MVTLALPDTGEPFGLPQGTVRGLIALVFTGLIVYQFAATGTASAELLATAGPYLGFYFAGRQADNATKSATAAVVAAVQAPVEPPYIPGSEGTSDPSKDPSLV